MLGPGALTETEAANRPSAHREFGADLNRAQFEAERQKLTALRDGLRTRFAPSATEALASAVRSRGATLLRVNSTGGAVAVSFRANPEHLASIAGEPIALRVTGVACAADGCRVEAALPSSHIPPDPVGAVPTAADLPPRPAWFEPGLRAEWETARREVEELSVAYASLDAIGDIRALQREVDLLTHRAAAAARATALAAAVANEAGSCGASFRVQMEELPGELAARLSVEPRCDRIEERLAAVSGAVGDPVRSRRDEQDLLVTTPDPRCLTVLGKVLCDR